MTSLWIRPKRITKGAIALAVTAAMCVMSFSFTLCEKAYASAFAGLEWSRAAGATALDTMELAVLDANFGFVEETDWLMADGAFRAEKVAKSYKADCVVVVTNATWHDAAAAQALAGIENAAVLITDPNKLSEQTARVVERLRPERVVVVGGPLAVSDGVLGELAQVSGVEVERIWGEDAVGTAIACYKARDGWGNVAFLATSGTWQDAVSAGPLAYIGKNPTFLTDFDGMLPYSVYKAIREGGFDEVVIMGGEAAVPESTQGMLESVGLKVTRLAGSDAVDTCAKSIQWAQRCSMVRECGVVAATVDDYHDASVAASCCGHNQSLLALVSPEGNCSAIEEALALDRNRAREVSASYPINHHHGFRDLPALALGGTEAIPQSVYETFPTLYLWY